MYLGLLTAAFLVEWIPVLLHARHQGQLALTASPLAPADARYSDWRGFLARVGAYGRTDVLTSRQLGLPYPYPAPTFYIYLAYLRLFKNSTAALIATVLLAFGGAAAWLSVHVYRRYRSKPTLVVIWATLLVGFPSIFLLDRGNIEVFVWLASELGIVAFLRHRHASAALLFAAAASMKIYPAVLFLLFLPRRRYRDFILAIVATLVLSALAIWMAGPSVSTTLQGLAWSGQFLTAMQIGIVNEHVIRWDHSLFALYKQTIYTYEHLRYHRSEDTVQFFHSIRSYTALVVVGFSGTYLVRLRHMPLLNQYICLTIASVLLPYVSYEYTLVNLFGPFAVLLLFLHEPAAQRCLLQAKRWVYACTVLFAVVFAPLFVLALHHFSGQIKAVALLILLVLFLQHPLPSKVFGDSAMRVDRERSA